MERFEDRFHATRYADDEPVVVSGARAEHEIPERLFARAQQIAAAYELRLLPSINYYERTELQAPQCRVLAEEAAFVRGIAADALLLPHLTRLEAIADACWRSAVPESLVIEGP